MNIYFISDTPVGVSWQLPDYSLFGLLACFLVPNYVFQQFKWFFINLLLATCILRYALLLDVRIDKCFLFTMHWRRNRGGRGGSSPPPQYRKILYYFHILTIINHSLQPSAPPTKESFLHLCYVFNQPG